MAYVHKHPQSPFWSAWFTDENGQRTSRSTKQTDRREAVKIASAWEDDARAARQGILAASHVLKVYNKMLAKTGQKVTAEATESFAKRWVASKHSTRAERTAATYGPVVDAFLVTLGTKKRAPITAVGPADIEAHRDKLAGQGKKPSTVRNALKIIGAMFAAALRQGLVDANPVSAVEVNDAPQQQREPFTTEEVDTLLKHAKGEWQTAIMLGAFAGMRLGDAASLTWESVDLAGDIITFTPQKTARKGRTLVVPIAKRLHKHLMALAGDTGGLLCPTLAQMGTGGRFGLSGRFKALMEAAGIESRVLVEGTGDGRTQSAKSFHSLRHSFNTALMNAGVDEKVRMELSGHSTAGVNRKYSHADLKILRAAVDKISTSPDSARPKH